MSCFLLQFKRQFFPFRTSNMSSHCLLASQFLRQYQMSFSYWGFLPCMWQDAPSVSRTALGFWEFDHDVSLLSLPLQIFILPPFSPTSEPPIIPMSISLMVPHMAFSLCSFFVILFYIFVIETWQSQLTYCQAHWFFPLHI